MANNRILSVQRPNHPYLPSALCVKGAALKQYVHHKDRIQHPMKRIGPKGSGQFAPISWDEAFDIISRRLLQTKEESGAKATVFYVGHPKWFRKPMAELAAAYGTPNFCTESSTCHNAMTMAWELTCGVGMIQPDLAHTRVHVVWSNNPAGNTGSVLTDIDLCAKGIKLIVVDPRVTASAEAADIHLQLYPGTDGALALGIANVILQEGLEDQEFIEKYTIGFEEYRAYVTQFPPEQVSAITGVPTEKIVEAARMMAGGKVSIRSNGAIVHAVNGIQNFRAMALLLALTGSFGREGGETTGTGGPRASLDTFHHFLAQRPDISHDIADNEFPIWNEIINNEAQCIRLADVLLTDHPYQIRNLIAFSMNIGMWPDADRMKKALERVEFAVVTELFWNEACGAADIVLPACTAPERNQVIVGKENRLLYMPHVIDPGDKLDDIEILLRLAHKMNLHGAFIDLSDHDAYLNYIMRNTGVTLAELKVAPDGLCVRKFRPSKPFDLEKDFKTPSRKVEFTSTLLTEYVERTGYNSLPVYMDWRDSITEQTQMEYPMILCSGSRKAYYYHSRTYRLRWISDLEPHTLAEINPADAEKLGLVEGDMVRLSTPKGSLVYQTALDSGIKPGVVYVYHGDGAQNINRLLDKDYYDPISGFPGFKSYICRLEKIVEDGASKCI